MKIVCVSDTHRQHHMLKIPEGDVLIHAGDFTDWGSIYDVMDIAEWFKAQPHECKILIAGNHDVCFQSKPDIAKAALQKSCHYLENQELVYDNVKFFGSPYTPPFAGAFQMNPEFKLEGEEFWDIIPEDTDVLVTHGPPHGILDTAFNIMDEDEHCGCPLLLNRVAKIKPKLHIFGHIHESYGIKKSYGCTFVNAASGFKLNKPVVVEI